MLAFIFLGFLARAVNRESVSQTPMQGVLPFKESPASASLFLAMIDVLNISITPPISLSYKPCVSVESEALACLRQRDIEAIMHRARAKILFMQTSKDISSNKAS